MGWFFCQHCRGGRGRYIHFESNCTIAPCPVPRHGNMRVAQASEVNRLQVNGPPDDNVQRTQSASTPSVSTSTLSSSASFHSQAFVPINPPPRAFSPKPPPAY